MSIESAVEDSIIADFQRDPTLSQQTIRKHDYGQAIAGDQNPLDLEDTSVIVVTATDRGEFKMGSGIRSIGVEIQIRVNGTADNFNGTLLDDLTDKVRLRLMPSPTVGISGNGRENIFSSNGVKVFGITQGDITQRIESGLERIRTVSAGFVASQIA